VSGRLILLSGLGSVLGPLVGMSLMERWDIDSVVYMMAVAALLVALVAAGRSLISPAPKRLERPFELLAPQAAPFAHDPVDSLTTDRDGTSPREGQKDAREPRRTRLPFFQTFRGDPNA
jgi:hypothetical protein